MIFQNNKKLSQTHTILALISPSCKNSVNVFVLFKVCKENTLFKLSHQTGCSNGILYYRYLFQYWALKINYRALRPVFPCCEQRFFKFQYLHPMLETMDRSIAFKEGMPAFVHLDYLKAIKLTLAHSEFSTYTQMNTLFLKRNKTRLMFTKALNCMPIPKIRLLLKLFQRKSKLYEVS